MIKVLLVGRGTASIAVAMRATGEIEVDEVQLPAAAVRQMEATPPDAICLLDSNPTDRTSLLVQGIRARPLGQLTPIVLLAPRITADWLKNVDSHLSDTASSAEVIAVVFELLGVDDASLDGQDFEIEILEQPEEVPYYIEEIVEVAPRVAPARPEMTLDGATIRRKLKAVRHEDYFVILEVGRGSETSAIREAFYRLSKAYDVSAAPFTIATEYETELLEIADAIEDAWAVLGDFELRSNYLAQTTRT